MTSWLFPRDLRYLQGLGAGLLAVGLAAVFLAGCSTPPPPPNGNAGAATGLTPQAAPAAEVSVKPGINESYLKPQQNLDEWVERFERESREIYARREAIENAVGVKAGMTVGDIGTGTGLFIPSFARAAGPKGMVYAVDIVPDFLAFVEKRNREAGRNNVVTVLCTERSVELPEKSIDLAFICDVYHHFEYPQISLASIHRALRPNGDLVIIDFIRIEGVSSEWTLNHVRAGEEVVTREIEAAGFRKVASYRILKDNYMLRFRKGN